LDRSGAPWPAEFVGRMRALLGDELPAFLDAMGGERARGLRVNPLKVDPAELARLLPVALDPVPWSPTGRSFGGPGTAVMAGAPGASALGGHPAHLAGLFYLQDPAAMSAVEVLRPEPGWRVADVAAAPGGKTTDLAARVGPGGLVLANDVAGDRLRALHDNLDRWGAGWVVTAGARLEELAAWAPGWFDAALLDAPCSGEAMMRRDPVAVAQWSPALVAGSARRQARLLALTARLVRPGGRLVYSTCTFEVEENEAVVAAFLEADPGWELEEAPARPGFAPGVRVGGWPTERTVRLWPHRARGDGQFVAALRRGGERGAGPGRAAAPPRRRAGGDDRQVVRAWEAFAADSAPGLVLPAGRLTARGPHLFHLPATAEGLPVDRLVRPGLPLGTARPGRFQPSAALAGLAGLGGTARSVSWAEGDERLARFLRGETVEDAGPGGWVLVRYERWGIGWGRRSEGVIKNFLPRHLRR
jgi:16S rRNA C967 or C1407 C5-methylase (RsmB/RsmF family)/NOL1/NOP2/fmu family ribosome biogenesis protein